MATDCLWICVLFGVLASGLGESRYSAETRLRRTLFGDSYEKTVIPMNDSKNNVTLEMAVTLVSIDELDVTRQVLKTHVRIRMQWTDVRLTWNPDQYDELNSIIVPASLVWKPDIIPYNIADTYTPAADFWMVVKYSGEVVYLPHIPLTTTCSIDLKHFPFDEQTCELLFGTWTYNADQVPLVSSNDLDMSIYEENKVWQLVNSSTKVRVTLFECCPEAYAVHITKLILRRRASAVVKVYVGPAVCMSLLVPFVAMLPVYSNSKLVIGSGLLVAHLLLLEMLVEIVPISDLTIPNIVLYYLANIILISLSLALSCAILWLWQRAKPSASGVPSCIRKMFLGVLGRLLCVRREDFMADSVGENDRHNEHTISDDQRRTVQDYERLVVPAEWRQLAVILDRLVFVVLLVAAVFVVIAFLAYSG